MLNIKLFWLLKLFMSSTTAIKRKRSLTRECQHENKEGQHYCMQQLSPGFSDDCDGNLCAVSLHLRTVG